MTDLTNDAAPAVDEHIDTSAEDQQHDTPAEDAGAEGEDGAEAPKPKPKPSATQRINELTAARRQAERERDEARQELERAKGNRPAAADGAPNPEDYEYGENDARYIEAKVEHRVMTTLARRDQQMRGEATIAAKATSFNAAVAKDFPEGEPEGIAVLRSLDAVPLSLTELIMDSDVAPKLANHLGSNISDLRRLSALPPHLQGREIARLESRLSDQPPRKTASDAPPPPQAGARGAGGRFQQDPAKMNDADLQRFLKEELKKA